MKDFIYLIFGFILVIYLMVLPILRHIDTHIPFVEGSKLVFYVLGGIFFIIVFIDDLIAKIRHK